MGYAEGPTARSAPRRIYNWSELWELCAVGRMRFQALLLLPINFARNSPTAVSKIELWSLELQRFWMLLNVHAVELRATFVWPGCCGPCGGLHAGRNRGFCTTRSPLAACRRRVGPSCSAIPPVLALLQQFRMQFPLAILFVCFSSHRCVTCVLELHATLSGSDYGWGVVGLKKPGRVRRIAQRAPASSLRDAATQRRSKPASHAARMGFASATS